MTLILQPQGLPRSLFISEFVCIKAKLDVFSFVVLAWLVGPTPLAPSELDLFLLLGPSQSQHPRDPK